MDREELMENQRRSQLAVNRGRAAGIVQKLLMQHAAVFTPSLANLIVGELAAAGLVAAGETWYRGITEDGEVMGDEITFWDDPEAIRAEAYFYETKGKLQEVYMCEWRDIEELYIDEDEEAGEVDE